MVSPATRARQTWELAATAVGGVSAVDVDDRIYVNTVEDVLAVVRETDESARTAVVVGHNPTVEALALMWGAGGGVPTGAIVDVEVDGPWADIGGTTARATDVVVCRG